MALLSQIWKTIHRICNLQSSARADNCIFRGYFDGIWCQQGELTVSGWVLNLNGPYDLLELYVNGKKQPPGEMVLRSDVGCGLPDIPNAERSGFTFRALLSQEDQKTMLDIRLSCLMAGRETGVMRTGFVCDMYQSMPAPPEKLLSRVDGSVNPEFYLLKGAQNYQEFLRLIDKHTSRFQIASILDWGCGSGRITGFFLKYSGIANIHGCDIDAEAVSWADTHFPDGTFSTIPLHPPTHYEDGQFDVIVSFSVLTHLDRETQNAWLDEMRRILKSGGLFLATVHGVKAARVLLPKSDVEHLRRVGIHDTLRDTVLEGVAPDGYYRASFQTPGYIRKNWNRYFEIVDILEQGASNYHDIVVMRKPV